MSRCKSFLREVVGVRPPATTGAGKEKRRAAAAAKKHPGRRGAFIHFARFLCRPEYPMPNHLLIAPGSGARLIE